MKNNPDQPTAAGPSEGSRRTPEGNAQGGTRWPPGPLMMRGLADALPVPGSPDYEVRLRRWLQFARTVLDLIEREMAPDAKENPR